MNKNFLVNLIRTIHILIILYIFVMPFIDKSHINDIIIILIFIMYRWISNDHKCNLTEVENQLTGNDEGFIYSIINPIYKLNECNFNYLLYILSIIWIIILFIYKNIT